LQVVLQGPIAFKVTQISLLLDFMLENRDDVAEFSPKATWLISMPFVFF